MRARYISRTIRDLKQQIEAYGLSLDGWEPTVYTRDWGDKEPETVTFRKGDLEIEVTGIYVKPNGALLQNNPAELR